MSQPEDPGDRWPVAEVGTAPTPGTAAGAATAGVPIPGPRPTFGQALKQRVRFAGGELPLWAVLAPIGVALTLAAALMAGAATAREVMVPAPPPSASSADSAEAVASAPPAKSVPVPAADPESVVEAPPKPKTLSDRARTGETAALKELEGRAPADLSTEEALAIADGHAARDISEARTLRDKISQDPALIKDPKVLARLFDFTQNPITSHEALAAIANLPGPIGADMLYEVWTGTPTKNETTELARSLLLGKAERAKASPALAVALELRTTEDCDALLGALKRTIDQGDKRAVVSLGKLQRKTGCGPGKRQDCYPCLRKSTDLKEAMTAVRTRREPEPFRSAP